MVTPAAVPGAVSDLAAVEVDAGRVRLDWSAAGEDGDAGAIADEPAGLLGRLGRRVRRLARAPPHIHEPDQRTGVAKRL